MIQQTIILGALILGTITDLKKREVPDTLNFSLIALGLIISIALSIHNQTITYLLNAVTGLITGYAIGALFYYTGQWGGGDAKLIIGIGTIMGINPLLITKTIPLFLVFIITSLLVGAIYGLTWMIVLTIKNYESFKKEYCTITKNNKNKNKITKIILIITTTLIIIGLILKINTQLITMSYILILLITMMLYSKNILKAIEKTALIKKTNINQVTEGDWTPQEFKFKQKTIKPSKTGLTTQEIQYLKQKGIKNIIIKQGIPFVPSFLIAYIIILILGNWLPLMM
ncbi:A24 family peptidase [Candidatus Woesearchaeota archaeon]|nr:A24 family peptidase [Candidatus Woesearchaeota archaeon]